MANWSANRYNRRPIGSLIEEAPKAYRDIKSVLEEERDLVQPLLRIEPILVLKG